MLFRSGMWTRAEPVRSPTAAIEMGITSSEVPPVEPEHRWVVFGHLLRRVRVQAHVSTATASLAIGPGHRQRLADLEEGRLVATEAVLTRLERAYGCGSGVLLSVFRELEEFPDGSAYRKLAKAVSDAEDSEPVHVTTAIDGPARSIPSRLTALVTDNLLVSAVVPSAAGFATGVALPLLLGAPGSEVGLSHLTSTFGKESGLAVVGIRSESVV